MSDIPREDVIEDGQAECHRCGEWYRITAPRIPHMCPHSDDVLDRLRAWDHCYPGNLNIEMLVDDAAAEIARLRALVREQSPPEPATSDENISPWNDPIYPWHPPDE